MRRHFFETLTLICLIFIACACIPPNVNRPSVCDNIEGRSILCETAEKFSTEKIPVRLEDIGRGMIIVNFGLIAAGVYDKADALKVVDRLILALDGSVTYAIFRDKFIEYTSEHPDLIQAAKPYLDEFGLVNMLITETDKTILRNWLKKRREALDG